MSIASLFLCLCLCFFGCWGTVVSSPDASFAFSLYLTKMESHCPFSLLSSSTFLLLCMSPYYLPGCLTFRCFVCRSSYSVIPIYCNSFGIGSWSCVLLHFLRSSDACRLVFLVLPPRPFVEKWFCCLTHYSVIFHPFDWSIKFLSGQLWPRSHHCFSESVSNSFRISSSFVAENFCLINVCQFWTSSSTFSF